MNYNEILKKSEHFWVKLIAFEKEKSNVNFPEANKKTILMIGPEGGFSDEEVILAKKFGFQSISLGKRILRSETAAIFLLAKCIKD